VTVLIPIQFKGYNYHHWSGAFLRALRSKNKFAFVDDSILRPSESDEKFFAWDHSNTMVLSWLLQTLDPSIVNSILWMDLAYEVWQNYNYPGAFSLSCA
jgi:hypothetical protein